MTVPDRPRFVKQLDGSRYAGLNCTCAAAAMAVDRHTIGRIQTTGAYVRALTGDTSGGTTLAQVDAALNRRWGVDLDVEYGLAFATFIDRLKAGQGAILQGWEAVTRGTKWQASETFGGNHAWFVNQYNSERGLLVYDPLADGRRSGIAKSPFWIPMAVVREWAGKLDISDPAEPYRALGLGRVYAAFTKDTEPHVHLRYGGRRTTPFPDHVVSNGSAGYVRSAPRTDAEYKIRRLKQGETLTMYQVTDSGDSFNGSRRWYGGHDGTSWVHASRLNGKGGSS